MAEVKLADANGVSSEIYDVSISFKLFCEDYTADPERMKHAFQKLPKKEKDIRCKTWTDEVVCRIKEEGFSEENSKMIAIFELVTGTTFDGDIGVATKASTDGSIETLVIKDIVVTPPIRVPVFYVYDSSLLKDVRKLLPDVKSWKNIRPDLEVADHLQANKTFLDGPGKEFATRIIEDYKNGPKGSKERVKNKTESLSVLSVSGGQTIRPVIDTKGVVISIESSQKSRAASLGIDGLF